MLAARLAVLGRLFSLSGCGQHNRIHACATRMRSVPEDDYKKGSWTPEEVRARRWRAGIDGCLGKGQNAPPPPRVPSTAAPRERCMLVYRVIEALKMRPRWIAVRSLAERDGSDLCACCAVCAQFFALPFDTTGRPAQAARRAARPRPLEHRRGEDPRAQRQVVPVEVRRELDQRGEGDAVVCARATDSRRARVPPLWRATCARSIVFCAAPRREHARWRPDPTHLFSSSSH